jgi:hypothetical protein
MSTNVFEQSLELDQGVGLGGRVFGYDHERRNFVVWDVDGDRICVHRVDHDETESDCGPLSETLKLAECFLSNPNTSQYRTLLRACKMGYSRA